jgi:hypothetical protein
VIPLHETIMKPFVAPHVKGSVMIFLVGPEKRLIADESRMFAGLPLPQSAIGDISRHPAFLYFEKDLMNEHRLPA